VDDIVDGVVGCLAHPPGGDVPARVLNIGNHRGEEVRELVALLEQELGRPAIVKSVPRPPMDVEETFADVDAIGALTGYRPSTSLAEGIPRFVAWFRGWNGAE
jgi:UDP-glucuronate 4-epimerase